MHRNFKINKWVPVSLGLPIPGRGYCGGSLQRRQADAGPALQEAEAEAAGGVAVGSWQGSQREDPHLCEDQKGRR